MAERSVTIRLRGDISDFSAKMKKAGIDAEIVGKKGQQSAEAHAASLQKVGDQAGKIGLVAAAGLTAVVATAANFEQAMSNVAATGEDARESLDELREAAIDAGAQTAFSASEAAAGIENLAKAGVSAQDVLGGGLSGALSLAAAGGIEVADAAEAAATAMTQFGLAGSDVPHIADLLAAAAGKAQGDVSDMTYALAQSGLVADQVGLSIEETTGGLAAFASAGLLGSDAGTSFKTMLGALTPNSAKAAKAMSELGISAYDTQGNFVGLAQFAGNLQGALADMTDQQRQATLETIFGSDAVRAASVLYEQGADGVQGWIDKVDDTGYASETAAVKLDNLKGDLEAFMGSLETALIGAGDGSQNALRGIVQGATDTVNALSQIPGPVLDVGTALLGIVAITGGTVFLGTRVIAAVQGFREGLDTITVSAKSAKTALADMNKASAGIRGAAGAAGLALSMANLSDGSTRAGQAVQTLGTTASGALLGFSAGGPIGAAIGGGIGLIGSLGSALVKSGAKAAESAHDIDTYKQSLDAVTGAVTESTEAMVANRLEQDGMLKLLEESGISTDAAVSAITQGGVALDTFTSQLRDEKDALEATFSALDGYTYRNAQGTEVIVSEAQEKQEWLAVNEKHMDGIDKLLGFVNRENESIGKSIESKQRELRAHDGLIDAKHTDADATKGVGDAHEAAADQVDELDTALQDLKKTLEGRQGKRDFEQAVDDFAERVKKRKELVKDLADAEADLGKATTPAERETALDNIARIKEELEDYKLTLKTGEQAGRDWQLALEDIATEGLGVASTLSGISQKKYMDRVRQEFRDAARELGIGKKRTRELMEELDLLDKVVARPEIVISVVFDAANVAARIDKARNIGLNRAEGGPIVGPGTGTSDSIPAWLSNGEHVLTAAEVSAAGGHDEIYRWRRSLRAYATGGEVFATRPSPSMTGGMGGGWDMEQLVATVARHTRPLTGPITMSPHNYSEFERELQQKSALASSDGVRR